MYNNTISELGDYFSYIYFSYKQETIELSKYQRILNGKSGKQVYDMVILQITLRSWQIT